jgi:acyl-CoA thioesterase FadM
MRWIRLLCAFIYAKFRRKITVDETTILKFRVWITDIDVSIMNHAAILTVMEAARIDFMVRCGFFELARHRKWYFVSAAVNAQFIRPLKLFQKAIVSTKIFHADETWIYMEQRIIRHGKEMALCLVKSKVKKGRENVLTSEIIKALNSKNLPSGKAKLIEQYEAVNINLKT